MDYKEKYEEALERARKLYNEAKACEYYSDMEDYETIFPELKESEDEKIRKELIEFVYSNTLSIEERHNKWLAWLEKQCEQNPAWSEEDISKIDRLIMYFKGKDNKEFTEWFTLLKDRILPQPKQGWSEEDNRLLNDAISLADECDDSELRDWLKSLKPQKSWKPSDEQIEALDRAQAELCSTEYNKPICDLIDSLNKLREVL